MINVEMAKCLIDRNFFRLKKEEGSGLLKDKLLHLSRMLLAEDDKNEETEGNKFSMYIAKEGPVYTGKGRSPQGYHNIGCEEEGWSWCKITGPNDSSEYYYNDYFEHRKTDYFEYAYAFYFEMFRWKSSELAQNIINGILHCTTLDEIKKRTNELAEEVLDLEEMVRVLEWEQKEEQNESQPADIVTCVKTIILCGYFLYHAVNGTTMAPELTKTMNANFCTCFPEEKIDAEEYMDCFLSVMEESMDCSSEGTLLLMDLLLNVHFSFAMDDNEKTPTLYFFKSKPLKEYKELREQYKETELVAYLDKLVPMLEDPAFMFPGEGLDGFMLVPESCVVEYGYTKEEYICCYYYYERHWESEEEYVNYDYAFSIARKCFEVLLKELQQH